MLIHACGRPNDNHTAVLSSIYNPPPPGGRPMEATTTRGCAVAPLHPIEDEELAAAHSMFSGIEQEGGRS